MNGWQNIFKRLTNDTLTHLNRHANTLILYEDFQNVPDNTLSDALSAKFGHNKKSGKLF